MGDWLEAIGDWPPIHGSWTLLHAVLMAEPVGLTVVLVVLLIRILDGRAALQPWHAARHQLVGRLGWKSLLNRELTSPDGVRLSPSVVQTTAHRLTPHLKRPERGADVALVVAAVCEAAPADRAPYRAPEVAALRLLVTEALKRRPGLGVRYLVNERWQESRALLVDIRDYCDQFRDLVQARYPDSPDDVRFAERVSALTGAVVIADLSTSTAGAADRVVSWHTGAWHGRDGTVPDESGVARPYDLAMQWRRQQRAADEEDGAPRLGEYNGRTPTLIGVEVCQVEGSDGVAVVLETGECDYRSTEPLSGLSQYDGSECKKLVPRTEDVHIQKFRLAVDKGKRRLIGARAVPRRQEDGGAPDDGKPSEDPTRRTMLLNGKIGVISVFDGSAHFVLMVRSDSASNGRSALAPAAGGVVELAVDGDMRDADRFGSIDVMAGIRRELREELGLRTNEYQAAARAVFLANSRTRPRLERNGTFNVSTGELVATVLALGTTRLGPSDFAQRRFEASPGRGLFESRGLLFVPMGDSAQEFARRLMSGEYAPSQITPSNPVIEWTPSVKRSAMVEGSTWVESIGDNLDQAAFIAALYASASIFGTRQTADAFTAVANGSPWWDLTWPGLLPGSSSRVCRPPSILLADGTAFDHWAMKVCDSKIPGRALQKDDKQVHAKRKPTGVPEDRRGDLPFRSERFEALLSAPRPSQPCECDECHPAKGAQGVNLLASLLVRERPGIENLEDLLKQWDHNFRSASRKCRSGGADWRVGAAIVDRKSRQLWLIGDVAAQLGYTSLGGDGRQPPLGPEPLIVDQCVMHPLEPGSRVVLVTDDDESVGTPWHMVVQVP